MNAIDMLVTQHDELEAAFKAVLDADEKSKRKLFENTADALMSHVLIEETHFYPEVNAKRTEDILLESLEEHLSLKRLVADLLALPAGDARFEAKLHVLKEQAEHHHEEEEENLFPKVKKLLSKDELEALGAEMEEAQVELLRANPRKLAPDQVKTAAPLE